MAIEYDEKYRGWIYTGDHRRAADAALAFANRIEAQCPYPRVSAESRPEEYVSALFAWRAYIDPIAVELRKKRIAARHAIKTLQDLLSRSENEENFFPKLRSDWRRALQRAEIYEFFTTQALSLACREGGMRADKSDQWRAHASLQLYCKGVPKAKIAKLIGVDRRQITRWLQGWDPLLADLRQAMGMDPAGQ